MILYHGSKNLVTKVERRQATKAPGLEVPEGDLENAIYASPSYEYALVMAARAGGVTHIDDDERIITFENPELFDPDRTVYVYKLDLKDVPSDKIFKTDNHLQYYVDIDEVPVSRKFVHKAGDIEKFYVLENWNKEPKKEKTDFKIK